MWQGPGESRSDSEQAEPSLTLLPPCDPGFMGCVCCGAGALVNFNICAVRFFGLWRRTGISAVFLLLATLSTLGERSGGGVAIQGC